MEKKSFKLEIKALEESGEFEGYAAVFGNVDEYNDMIMPGAFTKTLTEKKNFPLTWTHDPREVLGLFEAEQDNHGLKIKGFLNLAVKAAAEKYALIKQGAIKGLSIGYRTIKFLMSPQGIRQISELKLFEAALCILPINELAQITDVKNLELKPYPSEHACRLRDPGDFEDGTFRRVKRQHEGKAYAVIMGKLKGEDTMTEQAYRYPKDTWSVDEAKAHCKDHDGKFEAASGKAMTETLAEIISWKDACCTFLDDEQKGLVTKAIESLEALSQTEPPAGTPSEEPPDLESKSGSHLLTELNMELMKFNESLRR